MDLSVREVARILKVSETTVRGYIASGRLPAQRRGRQTVVTREDLEAFSREPMGSLEAEGAPSLPGRGAPLPPDGLQSILHRMNGIEERLERFNALMAENDRLAGELRRRDRELAVAQAELEQVRHQLEVQQRAHEMQLEAQAKVCEERCSAMEKETSEAVARERKELESRLSQERHHWTERLAKEKESFAQKLLQLQRQEGFWSRLLKMMTWS